jgi:hypothetical protein
VNFYFEIYGLDTDGEGRAFYRIEYRIDPLTKRRAGPVLEESEAAVSSSFETSGFGAIQPQHLSIATGNLWEGAFRITIRVTDRRTLRVAERSATFSVIK